MFVNTNQNMYKRIFLEYRKLLTIVESELIAYSSYFQFVIKFNKQR